MLDADHVGNMEYRKGAEVWDLISRAFKREIDLAETRCHVVPRRERSTFHAGSEPSATQACGN